MSGSHIYRWLRCEGERFYKVPGYAIMGFERSLPSRCAFDPETRPEGRGLVRLRGPTGVVLGKEDDPKIKM